MQPRLLRKKFDTSEPMVDFFRRAFEMYRDGFRNMTIGKTLWAIMLLKIAVLFLVFKLFFFPNLLERDYDNDADRAEAVRTALTNKDGSMEIN